MKKYASSLLLSTAALASFNAMAESSEQLRVATFNVSMEAFNYNGGRKNTPVGNELSTALQSGHQQIKNIAEIIQKINPDVILLNEFDRQGDDFASLKLFLTQYLGKPQAGQKPVHYPYFYQAPVNTGVVSPADMNNDGKSAQVPADTYGFGYFPGHFAMAVLSKYPFDAENIRTFQTFKWKDMPGALKPVDPKTKASYYNQGAWDIFRLSSKSMWDIPVIINNTTLHIIASHPTPPVFDGPEDRNGKRNHDEIRLVTDYISQDGNNYIYDDQGTKGGLGNNKRFVILGDLNASNMDGDAIYSGISGLLAHVNVVDPMPSSEGGKSHAKDNKNGQYHTAYWGMRADYVLPSQFGLKLLDSGVFWPAKTSPDYRLVKDRAASSDHRMVWIDIELK